jgi:hypothetical protein
MLLSSYYLTERVWYTCVGDVMNTILDEISEFFEDALRICSSNKWRKAKISEEDIRVLYRLNGYCAMLSQTVLQMTLNDIVWECEILMRTISEGTIKLLYICGDTNTIGEKIQQYSEELSDYSINKDSTRAMTYVEKVEGLDDVHKHTYLTLDKFTVDLEKTRKERKQTEQRWSFLEMLNQIEKMSMPFVDKITALAYGYGLSSHFVHADFEAIGLIWDRINREEKEQELLHNAHKSRFMGDMLTMALARAWILNKNGEGDIEEYKKLAISFNELMKKILALSEPWNDYYREHYM